MIELPVTTLPSTTRETSSSRCRIRQPDRMLAGRPAARSRRPFPTLGLNPASPACSKPLHSVMRLGHEMQRPSLFYNISRSFIPKRPSTVAILLGCLPRSACSKTTPNMTTRRSDISPSLAVDLQEQGTVRRPTEIIVQAGRLTGPVPAERGQNEGPARTFIPEPGAV